MIYTGIGSRSCPKDAYEKMAKIAQILAIKGYTLRSGAAEGSDSAFQEGHLSVNSNMEIYIPWKKFVSDLKSFHIYQTNKILEKQAEEIASEIHPAWNRCSYGAKKLHTRNIYQILGSDLTTPSDFVICWTTDGKASGGTATAMNLAVKHNVSVYNINSHSLKDMSVQEIISHIEGK